MYSKEQAEKLVKDNIGSLEKLCKEAICTADLNLMLAMGFPERTSQRICEIIRQEAAQLNIPDLQHHYQRSVDEGKSNIINTIVRRKHLVYFATRANLHPAVALKHFEAESSSPQSEDICSALFKRSLAQAGQMKKKRREAVIEKEIKRATRQYPWVLDGKNPTEEASSYDGPGDFDESYIQSFGCSVV